MKISAGIFLALLLSLAGCGALRGKADAYNTTAFSRSLSLCDAEMWVSNEANEKVCIRRNIEQANTFLMTQDAGEFWGDFLAALAAAYLDIYLQGSAGEVYSGYVDDDTNSKWRKAAQQYVRKHYGAKAEIVAFERVDGPLGYEFQVKPGDQIPQWEETAVPRFVLASQMSTPAWQEPDKYSYGVAGKMIEIPLLAPPRPSQSLTAMLSRAVSSSRNKERQNKLVKVEVLDPRAYQRYLTTVGRYPVAPEALTN